MSADDRVVRPSEVGVEMEVDVAVLLGNVPRKAGNLHLLVESPVHVGLRGRVEEPQSRVAHSPDSANLPSHNPLFPAERRDGLHQFLVVVNADDKPVAILLESVHHKNFCEYTKFLRIPD